MIVTVIALVLVGASLLFGIAALDGAETAAELEAEDRETIEQAQEEDRDVPSDELNLDRDTGYRND